jgi:N-acetyltransferase
VASPLPLVTLEGDVVRLEPLGHEHVVALVAAASEDRATFQFTPVPDGEEAMRRYVEFAIDEHGAGAALAFATVDRASGRVVGSTRFYDVRRWDWPDDHPWRRTDGGPDAVEIGYTWLAPSAQRSAVNTEAKLLMLRHAFDTWRVHRVQLMTDVRNTRSRRAIERIGGRLEGELRNHLPAFDGAGVRHTALFSIVPDDWPEVRHRLQARLRGERAG